MISDVPRLNQPESHLWEAASILRGPVDAADSKPYVFPLLFFTHISADPTLSNRHFLARWPRLAAQGLM
jgi:type I restriction-modification system DNA methylase subunit